MPKDMLEAIQFDEEDDDDRIQSYLENNKEKVMCQFFLKGYCKYEEKCDYLHPGARNAKGKIQEYDEADDTMC